MSIEKPNKSFFKPTPDKPMFSGVEGRALDLTERLKKLKEEFGDQLTPEEWTALETKTHEKGALPLSRASVEIEIQRKKMRVFGDEIKAEENRLRKP